MDYLSHHGVQGQKWGVKNGPPYPLYRQDLIKIQIKIGRSIENNNLLKKGG